LRVNGYNANDSGKLVIYNKMRRQHHKNVILERQALHRIGNKMRVVQTTKRIAAARQKTHDLGVLHDKLIVVRSIGILPKEVGALRRIGLRGVNHKQYSHIARRVDSKYVAWWNESLRLRDYPTPAERLEQLLEKPVNRLAANIVSVSKKIKSTLLIDINPISRKKKRLLLEHAAAVKAERKAKHIAQAAKDNKIKQRKLQEDKAKAKVADAAKAKKAKIQRDQKRELRARMNMLR